MRNLLLFMMFLSFAGTGMANTKVIKVHHNLEKIENHEDAYHLIDTIEVTKLPEDYVYDRPLLKSDPQEEKAVGEFVMAAEKLLAFGKKIWEIVTAGKPTVTTSYAKPISVLPKSERLGQAFYDMENWSVPRVERYEVVYKNLLGMKVVSFTYGVYYQSGGTFEGKGKYLTGVNIDATNITVAWGFDFNATSELVAISNMGRSNNPVAAATIRIKYTASSFLQTHTQSEAFHITGAGQLIPIQ